MAWAAKVLNLRQSPPINVDGDAEDGAGGGAFGSHVILRNVIITLN